MDIYFEILFCAGAFNASSDGTQRDDTAQPN